MSGPDDELQIAINARLLADAPLTALVGGRIFDRVPADATFPYIQIGEGSALRDHMSCVKSWTLYPMIHVWSEDVGFGEANQIMAALSDCLDGAPLELQSLRLVLLTEYKSQIFRDADGLTSHGVLEFKAIIEKRAA